MNPLPLDNAILKLERNGLLTVILTCVASNDLNRVDYAVWAALREMVYHYRSFNSVQELKSAILSQRGNICHKRFLTKVSVNGGVALQNEVRCNGDTYGMFVK